MKKSLIALAVMAAAGAASAQSSVTLFGIVDVNYNYIKGDGNGHVSRLTDSGYNSSRLGFRGTEDLGGGMSASFWLEAGISNDDGRAGGSIPGQNQDNTRNFVAGNTGLNFNRRSTVSLAGTWGEVRLGRDYTPTFWNLTIFDPFGTNGVGTNQMFLGAQALMPTGTGNSNTVVRASNQIGYFLPPNLGGIYGQFNYWMGENASGTSNPATNAIDSDGTGGGFRLGYGQGPFNVAVSWARTMWSAAQFPAAVGGGDFRTWNIGGQWDFGMAKLMGIYGQDRQNRPGPDVDTRGFLIGTLVPVGAGEIRASYSDYRYDTNTAASDPHQKKLALGYVHNLSKRTALYATVAQVKNSDGFIGMNAGFNSTVGGPAFGNAAGVATQVNGKSTGYDIGIRHSF
jgi:predicted porin